MNITSTTDTPNQRRSTAKLVALLVLALSLTAVGTSVDSQAASAWQQQTPAGSPGGVSNLSPVYAADLYVSGVKQFTIYANNGPYISRSPAASGTQYVTVLFVVERWSSSGWVRAANSDPVSRPIASWQNGIQWPVAPRISPSITTGYFRLSYAIAWSNAYGQTIASTSVVSSAYGEHLCGSVNPNRSCRSYGSYVGVG